MSATPWHGRAGPFFVQRVGIDLAEAMQFRVLDTGDALAESDAMKSAYVK